MRIIVGCVDGNTYYSRRFTEEEILEQLDSVDGKIGTGNMSNVVVRTIDEFVTFISDRMKYDSRNETQTFSMEMEKADATWGGNQSRVRHFNVRHIVWWEIQR